MKKIISLTLVFVLLMSMCCISYAKDDWTEEIEKRYEVLTELRVVNLRQQGVYTGAQGAPDVFRNLSKTAFINYICNITQDYGFTDAYSEDAVKIAEDAGIIHKNQEDLNKPLYYDEAITMLVRLLGYGYHAEKAGGYPGGYIAIASRLGLTDGLAAKSGEILQEFDAITLLYNAINTAYVEIISFSDSGITYGNASETTFLYEFRKIYRVDGVLDATGSSAVTAAYAVPEGYIMINGYICRAEKDYTEYLGMNVEAYIHDDKNGNPIALCVIPNRSEELVIPVKDILHLSDDISELKYVDANDNEKAITISPVVDIVYNGQAVSSYTKDDFTKSDGYIRLINNNTDKAYDVVFIMNYRTVLVDGVSAINETVKDFYTGDTLNFKEELEEVVTIFGEDGEIAVADLIPGDVLRVLIAKPGGKRMITAYLSRNKITGMVTAQHQKEETVVSVDGVEYLLSKIYADEIKKPTPKVKQIQVGKNYIFSLDSEGKIAYVKEAGDNMQYGLVFATAYDGTFTDNCIIKVFTTEGIWKELPVAKKVQFDGQNGVEMNRTQLSLIPTAQTGNISVIGYRTDESGTVIAIDLPENYTEENGKNGSFNTTSRNNIAYRSRNKSFNSEILLTDNVQVWTVNGNAMAEESSYAVATKNMFEADSFYNVSAFNLDEFGLFELMVVRTDGDTAKSTMNVADLMVVEGIEEGLDPEGNQVKMITGVMGTYDIISFYCADDMSIVNNADDAPVSQLNKGDVISLYVNSAGYVSNVRRYTSLAEISTPKDPSSMHNVAAVVQGKVHDISVSKNVIKIDCGTNKRTIRTSNTTNVILYNLKRNKISKGTLSDIEKDNIVMTKVRYHSATTLVVFQ